MQYDPKSSSCKEVLAKDPKWNSGWKGNMLTLACFKQNIVIVMDNQIELWSASRKDWHTCPDNVTRWYPPVAWRPDAEIRQIRMNDTTFALLVESYHYDKGFTRTHTSFEFEIRNHGMSILQCIDLKPHIYCAPMRLCCLPKAAGWLLFAKNNDLSFCFVIGNDGKLYKQNIVLSSNIDDMIVFGDSIVTRKTNGSQNTDLLDIYDWRI